MKTISFFLTISIILLTILSLTLYATKSYAQPNEGEVKRIIGENRKIIQKNPNDATAYNNLGAALIQSREYREAIENLMKAVQIKPSFAQAHFNLGLAYHYNLNYKEAADEYQKAVQYGFKTYKVYYNLGIVLEQLNDLPGAQKWYVEAITLKSDYANAYYNLAGVCLKLNQIENAKNHYGNYLKYAPDREDRDVVKSRIDSLVGVINKSQQPPPMPQPPKDTTPPIVSISRPIGIAKSGEIISVEESEIIVAGVVSDNQSLRKITINNKNIPISENNLKERSFEERVQLKIDRNEIKISAMDGEGNEGVFSFIVDRIEPDTKPPEIVMREPIRRDTRERGIKIIPREIPIEVQTDSIQISGLVADKSELARVTIKNREVPLIPATSEERERFKFTFAENAQRFQGVIRLNLGSNEIIVMAADVKGNTARDTVKITRKMREFVSRFYNNGWAILVGINNFEKQPWSSYPLNYAVNDAVDVAQLLKDELGFKKENIVLLLDTLSMTKISGTSVAGNVKRATKMNINAALSALTNVNKVKEDDRVLIYFSGHGHTMKLPTGGEMGFIIPEDGGGESVGDYYDSCLPMEQVNSRSKQIPAKHVLFLVDACYSGLTAITKGVQETQAIENLAKMSAKEIITAGLSEDKSVESPELGHGAFTYKLLEGLEKGTADFNNDGYITALELSLYLRQTVPPLASSIGGRQTPRHAYFFGDGEFIFELPR